jgi:hypothetical protein
VAGPVSYLARLLYAGEGPVLGLPQATSCAQGLTEYGLPRQVGQEPPKCPKWQPLEER